MLIIGSLLVIFLCYSEIQAHGMLMEPVNRGSAWRKGFNTTINYTDNQNYCGGLNVQYYQNWGKCGVCGDNYVDPQPRNNENGGKYGTGTIVRHYRPGQIIKLQVEITANHQGYFEFSACPLNSKFQIATEECFDAYPIYLTNGQRRYIVPPDTLGLFNIMAVLPRNLACEHCVLRWHYYCGNNWAICPDDVGRLGCGPQETFRSCSDISITSAYEIKFANEFGFGRNTYY